MQIRRDILVPATSVISCEDCEPSQKIALDKNGSQDIQVNVDERFLSLYIY